MRVAEYGRSNHYGISGFIVTCRIRAPKRLEILPNYHEEAKDKEFSDPVLWFTKSGKCK